MAQKIIINSDSNLQGLVDQLVEKYNPVGVVYFGSSQINMVVDGPFQDELPITSRHYCLLVVTEANARIDHEMQEFATNNYTCGTVTLLSHGKQTVLDYIQKSNRFFLTVLRHGTVVYPPNGLPILSDLPLSEIDHQRAYLAAERNSRFHLELAECFYSAVDGSLESNNWNGAAFLANQTIEQICLALNHTYLGYRPNIHNIDRLLKLCTCFTQELTVYFPKETAEQIRLYRLLNNAYTDARYGGSEFVVESSDAFALATTLDELIKVADKLCSRKLAQLKAKADLMVAVDTTPISIRHPAELTEKSIESCAMLPLVNKAASPSFRQNVIDLLISVVKPSKIYGRFAPGEDWRKQDVHLHLVIVIGNKRQDAFKDIDPLIGLAKLNDNRLTCSLHQFAHLEDKLSHGHVFFSPLCIPGNLIYDDGGSALKSTVADQMDKVLHAAGDELRAGMLKAYGFLTGAKYYYETALDKTLSAFMLQQATELTYRSVIIALYGLDIRSHSIVELKKHIEVCAPALNDYLPSLANNDKRLISILEDAYTSARYKNDFKIRDDVFNVLYDRVKDLVNAAIALCDEKFPLMPVVDDDPKSYSDTFFQAG